MLICFGFGQGTLVCSNGEKIKKKTINDQKCESYVRKKKSLYTHKYNGIYITVYNLSFSTIYRMHTHRDDDIICRWFIDRAIYNDLSFPSFLYANIVSTKNVYLFTF